MLPSIFGEDLFDDWMNDYFPFGKDFDKEFSKALAPTERALYGKHAKNMMKTDIKEFDDKYEVEIDLPGFKKDEVQVELRDGYLVVSAEKGLDEDEKDKKSGKYLRRERYAGSCQRSYYVGKDTTEDDIKAHFEHGMLTVTVAKKEAKPAVEEKKHIAIEG